MKFFNNPIQDGILIILEKDGAGFKFINICDAQVSIEETDKLYGVYAESEAQANSILVSIRNHAISYINNEKPKTQLDLSVSVSEMIYEAMYNEQLGCTYFFSSIEMFYLAIGAVIEDRLLPEYVSLITANLFKDLPPYVKEIESYLLGTYDLLEFDSKKNLIGLKPVISDSMPFNEGPYKEEDALDILTFLYKGSDELQLSYTHRDGDRKGILLPRIGPSLILKHNTEATFDLITKVTGLNLKHLSGRTHFVEDVTLPDGVTLDDYQCRILSTIEEVYAAYGDELVDIEAPFWSDGSVSPKGPYNPEFIKFINLSFTLFCTKNKFTILQIL